MARNKKKTMLGEQANSNISARNAEVDYSSLKINIIGGMGVLAALGFSYFLWMFLADFSSEAFIYALSLTSLFLTLAFLQAIFIKEFSRLAVYIFLETVALAAFFVPNFSGFLFAGTVLSFLFLLWGCLSGQRELRVNMKIRVFRTSHTVLPKCITALSLFIALIYVGGITQAELAISREMFLKVILPADPIVNYFFPGISMVDTFEVAARKMAESQLGGDPLFASVPPAQKTELINRSVAEFKKRVSEQYLKTNFESNDRIVDILYGAFSRYVKEVSASNKTVVFIIIAVVLFLLLRSFGTPFYYLLSIVAALIFEILRASGFAVVALEARSHEILILK